MYVGGCGMCVCVVWSVCMCVYAVCGGMHVSV